MKKTRGYVLALSYMLLAFVLFISLCCGFVRVSGLSMYPELNDGVLVATSSVKMIKGVQRGDVVVCYFPEHGQKHFIKRVIAKNGDTVEIKEGRLFVNDKDVTEKYYDKQTHFKNDFKKTKVPQREFFVMGDNVNDSTDSRIVGTLKKNEIAGVVIAQLFPKFKSFV